MENSKILAEIIPPFTQIVELNPSESLDKLVRFLHYCREKVVLAINFDNDVSTATFHQCMKWSHEALRDQGFPVDEFWVDRIASVLEKRLQETKSIGEKIEFRDDITLFIKYLHLTMLELKFGTND